MRWRRREVVWERNCRRWACWVLAVALGLAVLPRAHGAGRQKPGRDIYRKLCAECHGREGEGVPGKYDGPLQGDWSVDRLTRVIERTMPEGAPEKCVGEDAAVVARYIHDTFYSREARARRHPARVELSRLTNRQYVNTVADLLGWFSGGENRPGADRGLRAVYYNARGFNGDKKVLERVDRRVDFDFGTGSPDAERIGSEEFSMQWRGSVLTEETGDHELIVRTPNGVRLWVNGDDEPVVDAWVASGEVQEHKVTLRLIGGRAYPLRLDFFKFKDKSASVSLQWKPPRGAREVIPNRNLSPARVTRTFVVATPFPADDSSVGYERGVGVSKAWDEASTQAAIETAHHVVQQLDRYSGSKPSDTNRVEKVRRFCVELVQAAYRRPLNEEERRGVEGEFQGKTKVEEAVKRVVLRTLKSPRFLYLGLESGGADDYGAASRLSYGLWDSLPDRPLMQAAGEGRLRTREQVVAQAERMLGDPRAQAKMRAFLHHWLQANHAEDLSKDPGLFPGFTPEMVSDLRTSLNLFLDSVVWGENPDYRRLLLSETLFVNQRLAEFYGLEVRPGEDFVAVDSAPGGRSGVLTHPYLLAAFSYPRSTSPIHRGVFLTRNIVGRALKPPPVAVAFKDAEFAPGMTMREKVAELTRAEACQTCHSVINPLGFSLEHYDAVGRYRTEENRRPIDAVSEYLTEEGGSVRLSGARDVATYAVTSAHARREFIEQLFHQVVKQPVLAYGPGVMDRLHQSWVDAGFNLRRLLVEIATVSALHRAPAPSPDKSRS